ncbi:hypothetical protein C6P41_003121 [Kluyveromyces marxianus]|nr:hypothetical protein C6P41_003121 [Kluyveromyces marxianus]
MSALDQSLDEIIGSAKQARRNNKTGPKKVSKNINRNRPRPGTGPAKGPKKGPTAAALVPALLRAPLSTRVNVEGLPRDINQDAEFFNHQVGGVQKALLSYNERGNSTGMATITFKNVEQANLAVKKFNNAPIDGGKSKLRLTLIVDPSQKTLLDRIRPVQNVAAKNAAKKQVPAKAQPKKKTAGPNKKAIAAKQKKRAKPEKKSLEDLDKEMADYFEESK